MQADRSANSGVNRHHTLCSQFSHVSPSKNCLWLIAGILEELHEPEVCSFITWVLKCCLHLISPYHSVACIKDISQGETWLSGQTCSSWGKGKSRCLLKGSLFFSPQNGHGLKPPPGGSIIMHSLLGNFVSRDDNNYCAVSQKNIAGATLLLSSNMFSVLLACFVVVFFRSVPHPRVWQRPSSTQQHSKRSTRGPHSWALVALTKHSKGSR